MDCNKEDAIKAQEVAEGRLAAGDYVGAKKFILKSQRLFPSLRGLTQMSALVDVHINAGNSGNEVSMNWQKILQVEECADEETVRKQYRKLVLLLHPDKNKYVGAESAFKLVQCALGAFEEEKEYIKSTVAAGVSQRFWTFCTHCDAPSEQLDVYEFKYVQCPQCLRSFQAVRLPSNGETSQSRRKEEHSNDLHEKKQEEMNSFNTEQGERGLNDQKVETLLSSSSSSSFEELERRKSNISPQSKRKATLSPSSAPNKSRKRIRRKCKGLNQDEDHVADTTQKPRKRATCIERMDVDHSCNLSSKEGHSESVSHSKREAKCSHSPGVDTEVTSGCNLKDMQDTHAQAGETSQQRMEDNGLMQDANIHDGECSHQQENKVAKDDVENDMDKRLSFFEKLKSILMNEFKSGDFQISDVRQEDMSECVVDKEGVVGSRVKAFNLKMDVSFTITKSGTNASEGASEDCMVGGSGVWEESEESVECQVPDNDVFNFDDGRQENCFEADQIWAIYDDTDGLPRFYAQICEVISVRPFHVFMKWLYPAEAVYEEAKAWIDAGFAYTCGEFILGKKKVSRKSVRLFSHRMAHVLGEVPDIICIYPQKGDVWALYKVWKPRKGRTRKCEAVVVLSEFTKELGIQVATLFQVCGYKSIYCRKGTEGFRNIPAAELSRFSHQIPAHYLVGHELNKPEAEEWVDLDTAAFM